MNVNTKPTVAPKNTADDVSILMASFASDLEDSTKPLALLVEFFVRDGTQQRVEAAFAEAKQPTAAEPGVISFEVHRERSVPTRFVVYERWRSLGDLEAHLRTPYIRTLRRVIDEVIDGAPEFRLLTAAS